MDIYLKVPMLGHQSFSFFAAMVYRFQGRMTFRSHIEAG